MRLPEPFALALLLTLVAFAIALVVGEASAGELVDAWAAGGAGFWSYLGFAMQMCLILVTGFAVAATRPVQLAIEALARLPRGPGEAAALVAFVSMALALVHWGLGIVAGALLARDVGLAMHREGRPVHYPLLGAAGYTGMCVWHAGLSGSAPLKVTKEADRIDVLGAELAQRVGELPLTETVLSPYNLVVVAILLVVVPATCAAMVPRDPAAFVAPPPGAAPAPANVDVLTPLDRGPWLVLPVVGLMAWWVIRWASSGGISRMGPNELNFVFLAVGLALLGSPAAYQRAASDAARATAGILVQFPFYAGIRGLLVAGGVVALFAAALPEHPTLLRLSMFLSAGLANVFIPSGGGQWGVQGPILMQAAVDAGIPPARAVLAFAYGDQWTNLVQPFWALPLLGITGSRAGDILGYTTALAGVTGVVFAVAVLVG
ncbi:MAG: short-chain fatty acids transporter [Myxococcota bacterium]